MSSWANRLIPRKRDLSQIPEEFRPVIVPRVEQPTVVLSESFQTSYEQTSQNEIIYPSDSQWKPMPFFSGYDTKSTSVFSKSVTATELIHNEKTYVFVILRNIQQASDNDLWLAAYHSIRQYYTNQIIIIDDNSTINTVNGKLVNTEIIQSEYNGAGELLPYYYFQKNKWADTMIFMHDSMTLHRPFKDSELDHEVVFHWHFTESNDVVIKKSVALLSAITRSSEIADYALSGQWIGCFGGAIIIDANVIDMLEAKYNISKLVMFVRTRKQREIIERIIGILLSYEKKVTSNFGNIMEYPKQFETTTLPLAIHNVVQANYNTAIIKLWRGR
jgi:hypothetical protein